MAHGQDYGQSSQELLKHFNQNLLLLKTSVDYSQQQPTMVWNIVKKTWDYSQTENLFEQWEPFLGTWPTSGMMQNGKVFELPMQAHPITGLESSSSPTLPTPAVGHIRNHDEPIGDYLARRQKMIDGEYKGMPGVSLSVAVRMNMLPTVTTQDAKNNAGKSQFERNTLPLNAEVTLLGTPRATASDSSATQVEAGATKSGIEDQVLTTNWGKFTAAIQRWESLTRPAPSPTKPDGKDGNHRLSAEFTEWMMGLPQHWLTNIGLTRNQEIKACGNGVVPQQAELALKQLLGMK